MASFLPYLNFDGTCREAMTRYQEVFGGELVVLGPEVAGDAEIPPGFEGRAIHAALMLEGGGLLMASDTQPGGMESPPSGTYVSYQAEDPDAARGAFDALADGATIEVPFGETFFSPGFGCLTDRWGTKWMINVETDDPLGAG